MLKAEVAFDQMTLQIDKDFVRGLHRCQLPGMDEYKSDDEHEPEVKVPEIDTADDLAAMGMIIPMDDEDVHDLHAYEQEAMDDLARELEKGRTCDEHFDEDDTFLPGVDIVDIVDDELPDGIHVTFDDSGDLAVALPEIEARNLI